MGSSSTSSSGKEPGETIYLSSATTTYYALATKQATNLATPEWSLLQVTPNRTLSAGQTLTVMVSGAASDGGSLITALGDYDVDLKLCSSNSGYGCSNIGNVTKSVSCPTSSGSSVMCQLVFSNISTGTRNAYVFVQIYSGTLKQQANTSITNDETNIATGVIFQ